MGGWLLPDPEPPFLPVSTSFAMWVFSLFPSKGEISSPPLRSGWTYDLFWPTECGGSYAAARNKLLGSLWPPGGQAWANLLEDERPREAELSQPQI